MKWKQVQTTIKEKMSNQDKKKNARTQIVKPNIFLSIERISRNQINIILNGLKFTYTPKCNNIELKSNIDNYTWKLQLADIFQNKRTIGTGENLFQKNFLPFLET